MSSGLIPKFINGSVVQSCNTFYFKIPEPTDVAEPRDEATSSVPVQEIICVIISDKISCMSLSLLFHSNSTVPLPEPWTGAARCFAAPQHTLLVEESALSSYTRVPPLLQQRAVALPVLLQRVSHSFPEHSTCSLPLPPTPRTLCLELHVHLDSVPRT